MTNRKGGRLQVNDLVPYRELALKFRGGLVGSRPLEGSAQVTGYGACKARTSTRGINSAKGPLLSPTLLKR
jgi:hypothetical protein